MSVAVYGNSELAGLKDALVGGGGDEKAVGLCLTALAMANRSAAAITYGEWETAPIDLSVAPDKNPLDTVVQWARNLLYNCVSNGGTDFAPANYHDSLLHLAEQADAKTAKAANMASLATQPAAEVTPLVFVPQHLTTDGFVPDQMVPISAVQAPSDEFLSRADTIKRIREALKRRSGKVWSVRGDTGTAWGWITITAPPKVNPKGWMNEAQIAELTKLLGMASPVHPQGATIPASTDYYREFIDRAEGRVPSVIGSAYWD